MAHGACLWELGHKAGAQRLEIAVDTALRARIAQVHQFLPPARAVTAARLPPFPDVGRKAIKRTWTLAAMMCCEVKCGESTGGAEFEFAPQTLISEDRVLIVRRILLDATGEAETAVVSIKSAAYKLLHHDPPDLYLFNSMFLI